MSNKKKLTKRLIDSLHPKDKRYDVSDDQITGFKIRIEPGGSKNFYLQYRFKGTVQRCPKIGKYGDITVDQARKIAQDWISLCHQGIDPSEEKQSIRKEINVSQLCDLYLEKGCKHKAPSTLKTDKSRIYWHIKPLLGNKKISALRKKDVEDFKHAVAEGKTSTVRKTKKHGKAVVTGGKGVSNRTITLLSTIYSFAIEHDLISVNPCKNIKKYDEKGSERFLSPREYTELGKVLEKSREVEHPSAINMIYALVYTGCRKGEIQSLKWDYIDWDRGCINFPESKTGQITIPITPAVIEILKRQNNIEGNPYVFYGNKNGCFFVGIQKVWDRIKDQIKGFENVRLHDLRHSFASVGAAKGHSLLMLGKLLGHSNPETTARYAHLSDDPLREVTNDISKIIEQSIKVASS